MKTRTQILGQHFLHHKATIEKILNSAINELKNTKANLVIEIGPGKLALTNQLVQTCKSENKPLLLIERDRSLQNHWDKVGFQSGPIEFMDAASTDFIELLDRLTLEKQVPILLVSNLPYSASSQIIANFCKRSKLFSSLILMVQKELADRIKAPARNTNRGSFSLLVQSYFEVEPLFDVGPAAFHPPPRVTSTVLCLKPLITPKTAHLKNSDDFERFCKKLFSMRRKMVRKHFKTEALSKFSEIGISGTERPEELDLDTILKLYELEDSH